MTPQEMRRTRLAADYNEMRAIRGPIIQWSTIGGVEPHFERYLLTVKVRTIVGPAPDYSNEVRLQVDLPAGYPFSAPPIVTALSQPLPYHPNWFPNGRWCYGTWAPQEGLGRHVIRMVRILQFDPAITKVESPANAPATAWWRAMLPKGLFPSDRQDLPDVTASKPKIKIVEVTRTNTTGRTGIKITPL